MSAVYRQNPSFQRRLETRNEGARGPHSTPLRPLVCPDPSSTNLAQIFPDQLPSALTHVRSIPSLLAATDRIEKGRKKDPNESPCPLTWSLSAAATNELFFSVMHCTRARAQTHIHTTTTLIDPTTEERERQKSRISFTRSASNRSGSSSGTTLGKSGQPQVR